MPGLTTARIVVEVVLAATTVADVDGNTAPVDRIALNAVGLVTLTFLSNTKSIAVPLLSSVALTRSGADVIPFEFGTIAASGGLGMVGSAAANAAPAATSARTALPTGQIAAGAKPTNT